MKTSFRTTLFVPILVVGAVAAAYHLGRTRPAIFDHLVSSPTPPPNTASPVKAAPAKTFLSRDEARQRLIDLMGDATLTGQEKVDRFLALMVDVNSRDVPDLVAALSAFPASWEKSQIMHNLLQQILSHNPALALLLNSNLDDVALRKDIIKSALAKLEESDPQEALSELEKLLPSDVSINDYTVLFLNWRMANNAEAVAAAAGLPPGPPRDKVLNLTISLWAREDPQAALNWALSQPPENADVFNNVVVAIGQGNPQLAEGYLDQMTDAAARDKAIVAISSGIKKTDPAAALDWLDQMATGVSYYNAVNSMFDNLTQPQVTTQVLPNGNTETTIRNSKPDIPAALSLLDNLTDPAVRESEIETVATNWSKSDPGAALTWAQTLPGTDGTDALNSIVTTWSKTDPASAAAYVQSSGNRAAFLDVDLEVTQSLAVSSPQAALAFADSLPDGDVKNQALDSALVSMAPLDFITAWTDAAALPATDNPVGIMTNLVGTLANKDPAQAAGLIAQFPAGTAQDSVTTTIAATWIQQDPQAFTVWLTSLPTGDVRDTAVAQLVSSSQETKNPAGVLEWVNTVSDPQIKAALLQKLAPTP